MSVLKNDYTGRTFNYLTSMGRGERLNKRNERSFERIRCVCGKEKETALYPLVRGATKSCGCKRPKAKHGGCNTAAYSIYAGARGRCLNPNNKDWRNYGGRGIKMCERWLASFKNFIADMGERPGAGYQLGRIDNDGNYEPSNCRWETARANGNNTRASRRIEALGQILTIAQWTRRTGLDRQTITSRLKRGWSPQRALTVGASMLCDLHEIRSILAGEISSAEDARMKVERALAFVERALGDNPISLARPGFSGENPLH